MLQKGIYTYEYIDCWGWYAWEKFNDTSFPEKDYFYSHLIMEDITDEDYKLAERAHKDFEITNFGKHHDLYVQSDRLLLADVFNSYQKRACSLVVSDCVRDSSRAVSYVQRSALAVITRLMSKYLWSVCKW